MADLEPLIRVTDRFLRTNYPASVQQVILSTVELEQTCPSAQTYTVASSVV